MYWLLHSLEVIILSLVLSKYFLLGIMSYAYKAKLFDLPDMRKKHSGGIPRLGGIAFIPAVFLAVTIVVGIDYFFEEQILWSTLQEKGTELLLYVPLAVVILYVVGVLDDLRNLNHRWKLLAQILSAFLLVEAGLYADNFYGVLGIGKLESTPFLYFINILLITFIINAVNLIDGIDGLAASLVAMALAYYGYLFFQLNMYLYAFSILGLLACVVPFFFFNVYGKLEAKRKIFMGDTGSLTLGLSLCIAIFKLLSITEMQPYASPDVWFVVVLSPLVLPCFDAARVFIVRMLNRRSPFHPDRSHIHHLLQDASLSQRKVLLVLVMLSLTLTVLNVYLVEVLDINLLLLSNIVLWVILNSTLRHQILNKQNTLSKINTTQSDD